jgi:hypothetical protein
MASSRPYSARVYGLPHRLGRDTTTVLEGFRQPRERRSLDSGRHGSDYRRGKSALGRAQRSVYSLRPHVFFKPFRLDPGALMDVNLPQGPITRIDESVRHARRDDDDLSGVGVEVGRPDRKGR